MSGIFLYFIQMHHVGPIKIGIACNVERRLAELQVGSPYELKLLHAQRIKDTKTEKEIHRHLRKYHMRGEWFSAHPYVLELIEDTKKSEYVAIKQKTELATSRNDEGEYVRPHCVNTPCVWLNFDKQARRTI